MGILLWAGSTVHALPKLLPEIQVYHNFGHRGSSYSTVAGGMAIQLSAKQLGPNRWLHILGLFSPESLGSARGKIVGWNFHSEGKGIEIGVYDQKRKISHFTGAKISLKHLEWEDTHAGKVRGRSSTDVLTLGWTYGSTIMYTFGADIGTIHTPKGNIIEMQTSIGARWAF